MKDNYSTRQFASIEMGICMDADDGEACYLVPIDNPVRKNLVEMLAKIYEQLGGERDEYELTQKYGPKEKLRLVSSNPVSSAAMKLFNAKNLPVNPRALDHPNTIAYYFAVFRALSQKKVLGVRRATQFKGVLSARNRLVRMVDETLRLVEESLFRLDLDFDYVVEVDQVLILHPTGFEYTANVEGFAEQAVTSNIEVHGESLPFVAFGSLIPYVQSHKRAARVIAALRSRIDIGRISKSKLLKACRDNGIIVERKAGKIAPAAGYEDWFLKILDRRRCKVSLIENEDEKYEAENRRSA